MALILARAASMLALSLEAISTRPIPSFSSSSMEMVEPVSSWIPWITLPCGPITAPIISFGISMVMMRGT